MRINIYFNEFITISPYKRGNYDAVNNISESELCIEQSSGVSRDIFPDDFEDTQTMPLCPTKWRDAVGGKFL